MITNALFCKYPFSENYLLSKEITNFLVIPSQLENHQKNIKFFDNILFEE